MRQSSDKRSGASTQEELEAVRAAYRVGRFRDIVAQRDALTARHARSADMHVLIGAASLQLGRAEEAVHHFQQVVAIRPGDAEAQIHLGMALKGLGRLSEAAASYQRALAIRPADAAAHNNLGNLLNALGKPAEAMRCFERALQIQPDLAQACNNLGNLLKELGRLDEAIACYERALLAKPDYAAARAQKLHLQAQICDWTSFAHDTAAVPQLGVVGPSVPPFIMLAQDGSPERNRIRSERFCADQYRQTTVAARAAVSARSDKLRIGYFSADFHNHAMMHLMVRLFEMHDRSRFSVHGFSYGPDRDDDMRRRVRQAMDVFHDIRQLDDRAIAELAQSERIDVAIDLNGYTTNNRLGIFGWRAAPIQISYLGYPGTTGAPFIDYLVADPVVIPAQQRHHYSEKIIFLPTAIR